MRVEEMAKTLDFTVLAKKTTAADIETACEEAREHHFATVVTSPEFVANNVEALRGTDVKTGAVIGFPDGDASAAANAAEAEAAIREGVDEIDLMMNVPAMLRGDFVRVRDDLNHVVKTIRARAVNDSRGLILIKVVIAAGRLQDERLIRMACRIVDGLGVDYAMSGTVQDAADVEHIELMRDALSEGVGVKAAGKIESLIVAEDLVNAGATRLGTGAAVTILQEMIARDSAG